MRSENRLTRRSPQTVIEETRKVRLQYTDVLSDRGVRRGSFASTMEGKMAVHLGACRPVVSIDHAGLSTPIGDLHLFGLGDALVTLTLPNEDRDSAAGRLRRRFGRLGRNVVIHDDDAALPEPRRQLSAYFLGGLRQFDLKLDHGGTPFQEAVWSALAEIPFGETRSYADIARAVGKPVATRAVGAANGANPLPIIYPCHRVIGSNGTLTGYGGGLPLKQRLLAWERGEIAAW